MGFCNSRRPPHSDCPNYPTQPTVKGGKNAVQRKNYRYSRRFRIWGFGIPGSVHVHERRRRGSLKFSSCWPRNGCTAGLPEFWTSVTLLRPRTCCPVRPCKHWKHCIRAVWSIWIRSKPAIIWHLRAIQLPKPYEISSRSKNARKITHCLRYRLRLRSGDWNFKLWFLY